MSKSKSGTFSIHDPPGYISPYLQDFLLTDITPEKISSVAYLLEVEYLSPATEFPGSFPIDGEVCGLNNRPMINLVCRKRGNTDAINVIFLINTGSPVSYLSEKAMRALSGNGNNGSVKLPVQLPVMIHTNNVTTCYLSPHDKHFANVNVLGADFFVGTSLTLKVNYSCNICTLLIE